MVCGAGVETAAIASVHAFCGFEEYQALCVNACDNYPKPPFGG
jgi:hypothetical protein